MLTLTHVHIIYWVISLKTPIPMDQLLLAIKRSFGKVIQRKCVNVLTLTHVSAKPLQCTSPPYTKHLTPVAPIAQGWVISLETPSAIDLLLLAVQSSTPQKYQQAGRVKLKGEAYSAENLIQIAFI